MSLKMKDDGDDFDQMMFTPISDHHVFNNLDYVINSLSNVGEIFAEVKRKSSKLILLSLVHPNSGDDHDDHDHGDHHDLCQSYGDHDDHDHGDHDDLCQSHGDHDDHENSIDHDPLSSSYIRIMQYLRNFL